jgi:hypothetical protein
MDFIKTSNIVLSINNYKICFVLISIVIFKCDCFIDTKLSYYEYEQNLLNKLLVDYNPQLRPNHTVQIKLALNLIQIIDIIEKDQIMILNTFLDHTWTDARLTWSIIL